MSNATLNKRNKRILEKQLADVRKNAWAIMQIDDPSPEVQLASVIAHPESLRWIKKPTKEAVLWAGLHYREHN